MSFGFSIGDILTIINGTLKLYGQLRDAPAELHVAGRNVEQMRTALVVLKEAVDDRETFLAQQPAIALMIKHELKPLKSDLWEMDAILKDFIQKTSVTIMGRVRYAVLEKNRLQSIQSNFTKFRANFGLMLDLLNMKAHEQSARNGVAGIKKLDNILIKQTREADARKAEAQARERSDAMLEEILQTVQERLPAATKPDNAQYLQPAQVLDQLESELRKAGYPKEKAHAVRLSTAQALSQEQSLRPAPSLPRQRPISLSQSPVQVPTIEGSSKNSQEHAPAPKTSFEGPRSVSQERPALPRPSFGGPRVSNPSPKIAPAFQRASSMREQKSFVPNAAALSGNNAERLVPNSTTQSANHTNSFLQKSAAQPGNKIVFSAPAVASEKKGSSPRRAPTSTSGTEGSFLYIAPTPSSENESSFLRYVPATTTGNEGGPLRIVPTSTGSRKEDCRILCVDSTHGIRAILAQTYLEVLRVWTVNRSGRWLFRRVHSAGHAVDTDPTKAIHLIVTKAIDELLPRSTYEWARDYPNETDRIAQRMKLYGMQGCTAADLSSYNIIVCFTQTDATRLRELQASEMKRTGTKVLARLVMLPGCRAFSTEDCFKDPKKIGELIGNIKSGIKEFISKELGDWSDGSLQRTANYRTSELILPKDRLNFAGPNESLEDGPKLKEYERKSGCTIKATKYKGSTKEVLVSIFGPRERLFEAGSLLIPFQ